MGVEVAVREVWEGDRCEDEVPVFRGEGSRSEFEGYEGSRVRIEKGDGMLEDEGLEDGITVVKADGCERRLSGSGPSSLHTIRVECSEQAVDRSATTARRTWDL